MKTAISIPDKTFHSAEALAKRLGISRSELYSRAVDAFVNFNRNQLVTDKLNQVYGQQGNELEDVIYDLQDQSLGREPW